MPFMQAVENTVDSLSFFQTRMLDENFTLRPTGATSTATDPQQQEQVDTLFGPKPADSEFLAAQLLACYRGEIATSTQTGEYLAVNAMPDAQCRIFKKKMKKRIHEWEAAVRAETGESEVRAARKTPLRTLYELYRASKNRISTTTTTTSGSEHASSNTNANANANGNASASRVSDGTRTSVRSDSSAADGGEGNFATGGSHGLHSSSTAGAGVGGSSGGSPAGPSAAVAGPDAGGGGAATLSPSASPASASHAPVGHPPSGSSDDREAGGQATETLIDGIVDKLPQIRIGTEPPATMPTTDLYSEKHQIKQILHRFENEVFHALGYRPPRSGMHRRRLSTVYRRYGELKAELQLRTGGGASSVGSADTPMNEVASTVSR